MTADLGDKADKAAYYSNQPSHVYMGAECPY